MKPDKNELLRSTSEPDYNKRITPYLNGMLSVHNNSVEDHDILPFWKTGEWIWHGYIPRKWFHCDSFGATEMEFTKYFELQNWKKDISDYPEENWDDPTKQDYFMENFLKYVWLTNEFLTNGGFKNALFCHYNPRLQKIVVHPGGIRVMVDGLFGDDMVLSNFFNTGEFYNEFMDDMEPWDFDEMMGPTKYGCIGVPDHGSVIPHCGIDMNIIPGGKKEWYWKIYNRTTGDLSISVTRDYQNSKSKLFMSWLEPWLVSDNAQVNVVFKHYPTILDILRAVLVVFAEVDYTDEKIMVTHNAS